MAEGIKRVDDPASTDRCQAVTSIGQCMLEVIPGSNTCPVHNRNAQSEKKAKFKNYLLGIYYQRAAEMGESDNIKSLRDEIGLQRMILERLLNMIDSEAMLLVHLPTVNDCISKVEKLVTSCHKLEQSTGKLMDRSALLAFAGQVVEILASEDLTPTQLDSISKKLVTLISGKEEDAPTTD